jgi:hypothetical protein
VNDLASLLAMSCTHVFQAFLSSPSRELKIFFIEWWKDLCGRFWNKTAPYKQQDTVDGIGPPKRSHPSGVNSQTSIQLKAFS